MISKELAAKHIEELFSYRPNQLPEKLGQEILVRKYAEAATNDEHAERMLNWLHDGVKGSIVPAWFFEAADATRIPIEHKSCDRPGCEDGWVRGEDPQGRSFVKPCACRPSAVTQ